MNILIIYSFFRVDALIDIYISHSSLRIDYFNTMKLTFLGTGTSHGVPTIDCMIDNHVRCRKNVCRLSADDPKHARTRSSVLLEWNNKNVLIDASLDFRQQALREKITRLDAVLITHPHADHIGGMPDLRSYTRTAENPLPIYVSAESIEAIKRSYHYIFDPDTFVGGGIPHLETHTINSTFSLFGETVQPIHVRHGALNGCFGYRIGKLTYIPDMKELPDAELQKCTGTEVLVLNCLRDEREHISHLILPQSIALARRIRPKRCYFIHMCHDIHYQTDSIGFDDWMHFSYDGLRLEL
jgi:phosphoribosyl 1,2-cyclic phosphate phosphodiesterase